MAEATSGKNFGRVLQKTVFRTKEKVLIDFKFISVKYTRMLFFEQSCSCRIGRLFCGTVVGVASESMYRPISARRLIC